MKKLTAILASAVFLVSCKKGELPAPVYDRGDLITAQVIMGGDYKSQIWFSLHDNKIVSTNAKADWDLAFDAAADGSHIFLNGSIAMKVYKTNYTSLSEVVDTAGFGVNNRADMPSGNPDSTAIGNWKANNTVYIVNRGFYVEGTKTFNLGFYKLRIISEDATQYIFEYASMKGGEVTQGVVYKNSGYNFVTYSFGTKKQVNIEPGQNEYDLCFTQYTHLFHEPLQYYQVTGVLHNTHNTRVARITDKAFNDIVLGDTSAYKFDPRRDKIGYDWKDFDLNTNLYTVNTKICYLIQDSRGFYYKLHFIDFVDASGIKGCPKFEFKKL